VLTRLARTLTNTSRGAAAAAVRLQLARMAKAIGEEDIQLRLAAAEQLLQRGTRASAPRTARIIEQLTLVAERTASHICSGSSPSLAA
jgi:hypothetical protein